MISTTILNDKLVRLKKQKWPNLHVYCVSHITNKQTFFCICHRIFDGHFLGGPSAIRFLATCWKCYMAFGADDTSYGAHKATATNFGGAP